MNKPVLMDEFHVPAGLLILADAGAVVARLGEQRLDAQTEMEAIVNQAAEEQRDLTDEELDQVEELEQKIGKLDRQIAAHNATQNARQSAGRRTRSDAPTQPTNARPAPGLPAPRSVQPVPAQAKNQNEVNNFGFRSFGDFAREVYAASAGEDGRPRDQKAFERIVNVTTTYGNEGTGSDGGFLVPPDFRSEIWKKVMGEASLFARVQQMVTSGNSLTFPKDETTPWDTSTGVQAYWGGEGDQKTPSKPAFTLDTVRLNKLYCLVPVSDELLQDAPGLESWLRAKAPEKMQARLNTALIRGNGVGKPKGVLTADSLITITKQVSQNADSIVYQNIVDMWTRLWAPSRGRAVWIVNQDVEGQLMTLAFPGVNGNVVPVYLPAGGLSGSPYATLFGRPVVPVEAASTLGDKGDIMLVDWSQYMGLTKGQDIQTDVSIHIYFDQDLTAFRFVLRVAGQPMWGSAVTPENGSMTRSWAVALEDRA